MMPLSFVPQPADKELRTCMRKYKRSKGADPWKAFRGNPECGPRAVGCLQAAYGTRCVYCDHAHGRTVDHVAPKTAKPSERFTWANWRPSCGDCNNLKSKIRVVDPVRVDPRAYVVFDLSTGAPLAVGQGKAKAIAEATSKILDNQTLNEARRSARVQMVEALGRLDAGQAGAKKHVAVLLQRTTPHRAMFRELVLEQDATLNPFRSVVEAAVKKMGKLAVWANDPTA